MADPTSNERQLVIEDDDVTVLDERGAVVVQFRRLPGRAKVYAGAPTMESTSFDPADVLKFAEWLRDTVEGRS